MDNYAITDVHTDPWGDQTYEEIWEEQMLVYDEVNLMKPVILSREPAPYYETKGGGLTLRLAAMMANHTFLQLIMRAIRSSSDSTSII